MVPTQGRLELGVTCTEVIYNDDRMRSGMTDELRKNPQRCTSTDNSRDQAIIMAMFFVLLVVSRVTMY